MSVFSLIKANETLTWSIEWNIISSALYCQLAFNWIFPHKTDSRWAICHTKWLPLYTTFSCLSFSARLQFMQTIMPFHLLFCLFYDNTEEAIWDPREKQSNIFDKIIALSFRNRHILFKNRFRKETIIFPSYKVIRTFRDLEWVNRI